MRRRSVLALLVGSLFAAGTGCSEKKKRRRGAPAAAGNRPKGPQTMGNLMVDAWKQDLAHQSPDKRIRAAQELGNMGSAAKSALPDLKKLAADKNPQVAAAAKAAITAIGKK